MTFYPTLFVLFLSLSLSLCYFYLCLLDNSPATCHTLSNALSSHPAPRSVPSCQTLIYLCILFFLLTFALRNSSPACPAQYITVIIQECNYCSSSFYNRLKLESCVHVYASLLLSCTCTVEAEHSCFQGVVRGHTVHSITSQKPTNIYFFRITVTVLFFDIFHHTFQEKQ